MILVAVDAARIVIAGHASSRVACAAVSSVACMLRPWSSVWHHGVYPVPSLVIINRDGSELCERAVTVLRLIAREHPTHVRIKNGRP